MASVFVSYSHADEAMRDRLEVHLAVLKREGVIDTWHDRRIVPGDPLNDTIMAEVDIANIFLFLLSADFLASDYCYQVEMGRALEREARKEAVVIPVVLHNCEWMRTPLGNFMAAPTDGRPIAKFPYLDDGYMEVVKGIRRALEKQRQPAAQRPPLASEKVRTTGEIRPAFEGPTVVSPHPRSSNLAIRKTFANSERHAFLEDGFEFIARFFEESLVELQRRNSGVETRFRRNSKDIFTARAFIGGKQQAQCKIMLGGMFGNGISFSFDADMSNSINENLTVRAGDQGMMFDAMMSAITRGSGKGMSQQGAAEHLWTMFIGPLQDGRR